VAIAGEERVRLDLHRHERIAVPARSGLALALEAHLRAVFHAGRELEIDRGAAAHGNALRRLRSRVDARGLEPIPHLGASARRSLSPAAASTRPGTTPAPEQPFEKIAEVGFLAGTEAFEIVRGETAARTARALAEAAEPAGAAERHRRVPVRVDLAPIELG